MTVRNVFSAVVLLGMLALAGCSTSASTPQTSASTPTATAPQAAAPELTFLGSDGNVWEMAWPQGTPKQLTTDAADQVRYSGLAWSPDGSKLAVLRETGPLHNPTADALVLLSPTGQSLGNFSLSSQPYNTPFAWSPDGTLIAYRTSTTRFDPNTGDIIGRLTIISASDGSTNQTLLYDNGGGGCGGAGFSPLLIAMMAAHNAYQGLDTFTWTPDQKGLLVSRGCGNNASSLVDLGTQQTTDGYPENASYESGNNQTIVGQWTTNTADILGLTDASGNPQKTLLSVTANSSTIGVATWSPDGQTIYFERGFGIWSVRADGSNVRQVEAGQPTDSEGNASALMLPSVSPDGSLLAYLQLHGDNTSLGTGSVTVVCYVAQSDGSHATTLPVGATAIVWRPAK